MTFQKSPFPYMALLIAIVGFTSYTNLTIDKEIEAPILHKIDKKNFVELPSSSITFQANATSYSVEPKP